MTCRYCDQPVESNAIVTHSYWLGAKHWCHATCKVEGEKAEAMECQIIDADCNDCRHFKRGSILPHKPHIQAAIDRGECPNFSTEVWTGHCLKFDRPTFAHPKKWMGLSCFEHRRSK